MILLPRVHYNLGKGEIGKIIHDSKARINGELKEVIGLDYNRCREQGAVRRGERIGGSFIWRAIFCDYGYKTSTDPTELLYRGQLIITTGQLPNPVLENGTVKVFFYFPQPLKGP